MQTTANPAIQLHTERNWTTPHLYGVGWLPACREHKPLIAYRRACAFLDRLDAKARRALAGTIQAVPDPTPGPLAALPDEAFEDYAGETSGLGLTDDSVAV